MTNLYSICTTGKGLDIRQLRDFRYQSVLLKGTNSMCVAAYPGQLRFSGFGQFCR